MKEIRFPVMLDAETQGAVNQAAFDSVNCVCDDDRIDPACPVHGPKVPRWKRKRPTRPKRDCFDRWANGNQFRAFNSDED